MITRIQALNSTVGYCVLDMRLQQCQRKTRKLLNSIKEADSAKMATLMELVKRVALLEDHFEEAYGSVAELELRTGEIARKSADIHHRLYSINNH